FTQSVQEERSDEHRRFPAGDAAWRGDHGGGGDGGSRHDYGRPGRPSPPRGLDLETATVADLRPLLDRAELTSQTLTAAYLERIEALSNQRPAVNAVRMVNPLALEEARAADQMLK